MDFTNKTNWKSRFATALTTCSLFLTADISAAPFAIFDARTMAMGGAGVATGSQYAVFNNPALLTTADEIHEWFLLAPTVSRQINDPNSVEDSLDAFQDAADVLDGANNPANQAAVQQQLDTLDGNIYSSSSNSAIVLAIPSRILSGAAYFNVYKASTAKAVIGGDNLTIPSYASTLEQRGIRIVENGIAAAKVIDSDNRWLSNLSLGFNIKFLLIEGYGYSEALRTADVGIERANSKSGSQFGLDMGAQKEFGVWKAGLVVKNVLAGKYSYGTSGEKFKLDPQVRAGFAYQSRHSTLAFDLDLTENKPVGFDQPSQVAGMGWEWETWSWLTVRAGYSQNLTGNEAAYGSAGLSIGIKSLHIDIAALSGDEGEGASAQLSIQF